MLTAAVETQRATLHTKWITITIAIFQAWKLCSDLKGQGDGRILKIAYCLENHILELMTGNVVVSRVDALMYVILSKAQKHVPYGELVGTTECGIAVAIAGVLHKLMSL